MAGFVLSRDHVALAIMVLSYLTLVSCFGPTTISSMTATTARSKCVALHAAGMGMATSPKKGKNKGGKKGKKSSITPFDVNASLMRLEKRYDELSLANAKAIQEDKDDVVTSEYVIAARAIGTPVADWVPVVQMCIARPLADAESSEGVADPSVQAVVSHYCREIFHAATLGAPVFRSLPRNKIQYSVESLDSFHKYVYEPIVEINGVKAEDEIMTKVEARNVLKVDADENDMTAIKKAYRTLSFELHPDRFAGSNKEEIQSASNEYARVKLAYDTLSSGVRSSGDRSSWYESLGGRARMEFLGPISLLSLDEGKEFLFRTKLESAVVGLDPGVVQTFVVRQMASS